MSSASTFSRRCFARGMHLVGISSKQRRTDFVRPKVQAARKEVLENGTLVVPPFLPSYNSPSPFISNMEKASFKSATSSSVKSRAAIVKQMFVGMRSHKMSFCDFRANEGVLSKMRNRESKDSLRRNLRHPSTSE